MAKGTRKKPVHAPRLCVRCGAEYVPKSSRALYCGVTCYHAATHEQRKDQPGFRAAARERATAWRAANRERHRAASAAWVAANRDWYRLNMRAAQRRRRVGRGADEVAYADALRGDPCSYCSGAAGEIDHISPVIAGGENRWTNLTAACKSCNSRKHDKPLLIAMLEVPCPAP